MCCLGRHRGLIWGGTRDKHIGGRGRGCKTEMSKAIFVMMGLCMRFEYDNDNE